MKNDETDELPDIENFIQMDGLKILSFFSDVVPESRQSVIAKE